MTPTFPSEAYARWQDTPSEGPIVFCTCQHEYEDHRDLVVDFGDETRTIATCKKCKCRDFNARHQETI